MILPGHLAGGYLIGEAIIYFGNFALSGHDANLVIASTMIASVAPDIDLIYFFIKNRSAKLQEDKSHRTLASHAPLLWLFVGFVIYVLGDSGLLRATGLAVWLGSWTHFVSDSIEYGIMWIWPLSSQKFYLRKISEKGPDGKSLSGFYWKYFREIYTKNWTFWIELLVILLACIVYFK